MGKEYKFNRRMKAVIKVYQALTERDPDKVTPEYIDSINNSPLINNRFTKKIITKISSNITKTTYVVPVTKGRITVDYFCSNKRNSDQAGLTPLILFFHGGGWVYGNMEIYSLYCAKLAEITSASVLLADYRLAPKHKFPTALEDAYSTYKWALDGLKYWKIDPQRIFIAGDSAGGNIAASLCHKIKENKLLKPYGQILIYPVTDCRLSTPSFAENRESPTLTEKMMRLYVSYYQNNTMELLSPAMSPLLAQDFTGLPSALIISADYDPLRDDAALYHKALEKAEVNSAYFNIEETVHGFINYPNSTGNDETMSMIKQFVNGRDCSKIEYISLKDLKANKNKKL